MPLEHGHDATGTLLALTALMVLNNGLPPGRAMIMRCMMVGKRGFEPPAPASRRVLEAKTGEFRRSCTPVCQNRR